MIRILVLSLLLLGACNERSDKQAAVDSAVFLNEPTRCTDLGDRGWLCMGEVTKRLVHCSDDDRKACVMSYPTKLSEERLAGP